MTDTHDGIEDIFGGVGAQHRLIASHVAQVIVKELNDVAAPHNICEAPQRAVHSLHISQHGVAIKGRLVQTFVLVTATGIVGRDDRDLNADVAKRLLDRQDMLKRFRLGRVLNVHADDVVFLIKHDFDLGILRKQRFDLAVIGNPRG